MRITIVDYGMGNLSSVQKAFKSINVETVLSSDINEIEKADKLILPGVGHFKSGITNLMDLNLIDVLNYKVKTKKTPILGICLGMQLFAKFSEEGDSEGLGWINASVKKFTIQDSNKYKVPHIGWNDVKLINNDLSDYNSLTKDQYYFVHSYHLVCNEPDDVWMTTNYEYDFVSAVKKENIVGTQFHPEKSQDIGRELLKFFISL